MNFGYCFPGIFLIDNKVTYQIGGPGTTEQNIDFMLGNSGEKLGRNTMMLLHSMTDNSNKRNLVFDDNLAYRSQR